MAEYWIKDILMANLGKLIDDEIKDVAKDAIQDTDLGFTENRKGKLIFELLGPEIDGNIEKKEFSIDQVFKYENKEHIKKLIDELSKNYQ